MNKNDEKVKKALENEEVPKELEPENIKKMLDNKAPSKKRKKISVAGRLVALSAACAVIVGSTVVYINKDNIFNKSDTPIDRNSILVNPDESSMFATEADTPHLEKTGSYMTGAKDYEQIYTMIKESSGRSNPETAGRGLFISGAKSAETLETAVAENDADGGVYEETYDDVEYDEAPAESNSSLTQGAGIENEIEFEEPVENGAGDESSEFIEEPQEEEIIDEEFSESSAETNEEAENEKYSDTYNQEENVLEADIVKTNGKNIYYIHNDYDDEYNTVPEINCASVNNGEFTGLGIIDVSENVKGYFGDEYETDVSVQDMYLYNDMLVVLGTVSGYNESNTEDDYWYDYKTSCFVTFYTTDEIPQLIDTYYQDGSYNDVRISPDGYMYLITDYTTVEVSRIEEPAQIEKYIPSCGISEDVECIPAGDILLPDDDFEDVYNLTYTVIGSLDLTQSGTFSAVDSKALAGYTGDVYCSGSNLYTTIGWDETEITRISIGGGMIAPEACGAVSGRVNDQFSMSEYNGYFRIAVTNDEYEEVYHGYEYDESAWDRVKDKLMGEESGYYSYERIKRDNRVYVLDMDMNIVGSVADLGIDEEIKSVKFSGDMAYVVTYEQTDPLFAIDLSDPTNPTILDEFKILGYSTYMQDWGDGLLLGFGVNADENGIETGIKLTMFDNSDPYNLKSVGTYTIDRNGDDNWIYSEARWERKALLIAPEKNLIGIPVVEENYSWNNDVFSSQCTTSYMFFSYDNGEFNLKGIISSDYNFDKVNNTNFNRAVYIGDYLYVLKGDEFVSADIETITENQRVSFEGVSDFESFESVTESETEEITEPETEDSTEQENGQFVKDCEVLEVNDGSILCRELNTENEYVVSLKDVADSDDVKKLEVGQNVEITFDGYIYETYPMQINTVYKIEIISVDIDE